MEGKKMICFTCCVAADSDEKRLPKNVDKKNSNANEFAAYENLSIKTDRGKKKFIAKEIDKLHQRNTSSRIFKYSELCDVTNNFNDEGLIGEGGFGRVYKAKVDDMEVAIKKLDPNGFQGNKEFLVEVLVLSRIEHPNLVNLVGYCTDADQKVLVYEYLKNGSLEDHLLDLAPDKKALDWNTRMRIAAGAARGLEHLHETANPPIIYRDFKASNILLDGDFNSKLSDFGLAKFGPTGKKSHVATAVMGTYGYCAPEYAATGKLTTKSDIYSFGVVFLELISGRRVIDESRPEDEQNLVEWAQPLFKDKSKFELMADPKLNGNYSTKSLYQALAIAAMCLQEDAETRPYITDVVVALEFICDDKAKDNNAQGKVENKPRTNVEALQHNESNVGMEMN